MRLRAQGMGINICRGSVVILLLACACQKRATNFVVLERNSPAIGADGTLVQDIGLETIGGVMTPLLKTGCVTPCRDAEIFSTAQDNQPQLQVARERPIGI
jgi:molecular chaperone DnaK (HSP70)